MQNALDSGPSVWVCTQHCCTQHWSIRHIFHHRQLHMVGMVASSLQQPQQHDHGGPRDSATVTCNPARRIQSQLEWGVARGRPMDVSTWLGCITSTNLVHIPSVYRKWGWRIGDVQAIFANPGYRRSTGDLSALWVWHRDVPAGTMMWKRWRACNYPSVGAPHLMLSELTSWRRHLTTLWCHKTHVKHCDVIDDADMDVMLTELTDS